VAAWRLCPPLLRREGTLARRDRIEHPAPNVEPGDVVMLPGREALVTARVEAEPGPLVALLEVAIAPTPLASDDTIA
jgi:hypothetical protein